MASQKRRSAAPTAPGDSAKPYSGKATGKTMNKNTLKKPAISSLTDLRNQTLLDLQEMLPSSGEERPNQILAAAQKIIIRKGFSAFSARSVAADVGMSLGNLQYYFKTKKDLIAGVLVYTVFQYKDAYQKSMDNAPGEPRARLEALLNFLVEDTMNSDTASLWFGIWAQSRKYEFAASIVHKMYDYHRLILAQLITEAAGINFDEAEIKAVQIASLIEGGMLFLSNSHNSNQQREIFRKGILAGCRTLIEG